MPNPFTAFINANQPDKDLDTFVMLWDTLEEVCIATYKAGHFSPGEARAWKRLRTRLMDSYKKISHQLSPYWQKTTIEGMQVRDDPFLWVLQITDIELVVENWTLLQHLPPAREAINRCILDRQTT